MSSTNSTSNDKSGDSGKPTKWVKFEDDDKHKKTSENSQPVSKLSGRPK